MSWYDLWDNWLNTTIRCCDHNENNVGYYYFKSNSYHNKAKYYFGKVLHYSHKVHWDKKHSGKKKMYTNGKHKGQCVVYAH